MAEQEDPRGEKPSSVVRRPSSVSSAGSLGVGGGGEAEAEAEAASGCVHL